MRGHVKRSGLSPTDDAGTRPAVVAGRFAFPRPHAAVQTDGGRPLAPETRALFEPRFGFDFSRVRVHTDAPASASAKAMSASAFTLGNHITFAAGRFDPNSAPGRSLLAHELVHVIQQTGHESHNVAPSIDSAASGPPAEAVMEVSQPSDPIEVEAAQVAEAVINGGASPTRITSSVGAIARLKSTKASDDDVLKTLPPKQVAAWYGRLADATEKQGADVSALLMRDWLKNRDPKATIEIPAHEHIVSSTPVMEGLNDHREFYLTEKKAHFNGKDRWVGIIPRLQTRSWNGDGRLDLHYQGLATSGNAYWAAMKYKAGKMSTSDADVFTSLHDFQLSSDVSVTGTPQVDGKIAITFDTFAARALDRYDWDPTKHLTVPNPDSGSTKSDAVAPEQSQVTVYHTNAKRVEAAGLAAPYDLTTKPWPVTDSKVIAKATVDPKKKL